MEISVAKKSEILLTLLGFICNVISKENAMFQLEKMKMQFFFMLETCDQI